jgi:hypothetical protein
VGSVYVDVGRSHDTIRVHIVQLSLEQAVPPHSSPVLEILLIKVMLFEVSQVTSGFDDGVAEIVKAHPRLGNQLGTGPPILPATQSYCSQFR